MKTIILQQAYRELVDAVEYYEGEQDGLGQRMLEDFDMHVQWIQQNPDLPRIRDGGYRRVNLRTFPYYIPYVIREQTLWILAVAHSHRRPDYWIRRNSDIN